MSSPMHGDEAEAEAGAHPPLAWVAVARGELGDRSGGDGEDGGASAARAGAGRHPVASRFEPS